MDKYQHRINELMQNQMAKGQSKYGVTLSERPRHDFGACMGLRYMKEELVDGLFYLERITDDLYLIGDAIMGIVESATQCRRSTANPDVRMALDDIILQCADLMQNMLMRDAKRSKE